jgi:hypothetical protein
LEVSTTRQIGWPSRATTTAECSLWTLPRNWISRARAA